MYLSVPQDMSLRAGLCKHSRLALQMGFSLMFVLPAEMRSCRELVGKKNKNLFGRE